MTVAVEWSGSCNTDSADHFWTIAQFSLFLSLFTDGNAVAILIKRVVAVLTIWVEEGGGNCGKLDEDTVAVFETMAIWLERTCINGRR